MRATIRAACELHSLLERFPTLSPERRVRAVCLCPPGSNIVCYAFAPPVGARMPLSRLNTMNRRIYERFTLRAGERVYNQSFFISRTTLSPARYSAHAVGPMLERLGAGADEYQRHGIFLLRSVLMNPWYEHAKRRGRFVISELVADLYAAGEEELAALQRSPQPGATEDRPGV
jgi:hypothetical protein